MVTELGLRERKKEHTRRLIFGTASRLFAESGFDGVTVAEIARAAEVSEPTVFNYFRTKEDLFFGEMVLFEEELMRVVCERAVGESVLAAFRRPVVDGCQRLAQDSSPELIAKAATLISASQALQVREREVVARFSTLLARRIAEETLAPHDDVEAWSAACALMSVHRALVLFVRSRVLEGQRGPKLAAAAREQAARAFARLESGLSEYGIRKG